MQAELVDLFEGRISFNEFARRPGAKKAFEAFARSIARRWTPPPGVDIDDLTQEMLIALWRKLPEYDPERSKLSKFGRWNAFDKAKKWNQQQRNTLRRSDKNRARVPYAFSSLSIGDDQGEERSGGALETFIHANLARDPEYEVLVEAEEVEVTRKEALGRVVAELEPRDGYLLVALANANGDVSVASAELYSDADTRRRMRFNNYGQVRRAVRRALKRAAVVSGAAQ